MGSLWASAAAAMCVVAGANRAPEVAPELPEGWCAFGTPTRTTGECMCQESRCLGEGCVFEGGLHWYTLACAACSCERPRERPRPAPAAVPPREPVLRARSAPVVDDDLSLGDRVFEYADEHGHMFLAVLFICVLAVALMPALATTATQVGAGAQSDGADRRRPAGALRFRAKSMVV